VTFDFNKLDAKYALFMLPLDSSSVGDQGTRITRNLGRVAGVSPKYNYLGMQGAGWGSVGNALGFDSDDPWSTSFWLRMAPKSGSGFSTVFSKIDSAYDKGYSIYIDYDTTPNYLLVFDIWSSAAANDIISAFTPLSIKLGDNRWHHHCFAYDGSKAIAGISYELDGTSQAMVVGVDNLSGSSVHSSEFQIGAWNGLDSLDGDLDGLCFWDVELNAAQRLATFEAGRNGDLTAVGSPVAYWPFQSSDVYPVASDASGNSLDATFTGTTADVFVESTGDVGIQMGDGITSTTMPTLITARGMSFDGGDWLNLLFESGSWIDARTLSLCFLIKVDDTGSDQRIYDMGDASYGYSLYYDTSGSVVAFERRDATAGDLTLTSSVGFADARPHVLIATVGVGGMKLFANTEVQDSFAGDARVTSFPAASEAFIGQSIAAAERLTGDILLAAGYPFEMNTAQMLEWARMARQIRNI
jgi:hypothetical protein